MRVSFRDFQDKTLGGKSVFAREGFDFVTNLVKWLGIRFAYILYRLGWTANAVDVFGIFLVFFGFLLMSTAAHGERLFPLIGVCCLFFHLFLDFVDGSIARASDERSPIGFLLDELGCALDKFVLLVFLGVLTGKMWVVLANTFSAFVLVLFMPAARIEMPKVGWLGFICRIYCNKYSFLSVRFMLVLFPLFLGAIILLNGNIVAIARFFSWFYISLAVIWLMICIPRYQRALAIPKENSHADFVKSLFRKVD